MTQSFSPKGLTVVEVLVAIAILGIATAILATTSVSSIRNNAVSGSRTQATQVLNYLGRLVASADAVLFSNEDLAWDYGTLRDHFTELGEETGRADTNLYRASIEELGSVGIGSATMTHYRVNVCWQVVGEEHCIAGDTAGPEYIPGDPNPAPLPGIG